MTNKFKKSLNFCGNINNIISRDTHDDRLTWIILIEPNFIKIEK
jgi:hypothetical protein